MPMLDRLQARLGSERFQAVALSIDRGGPSAVQKFYAEVGVSSPGVLHRPDWAAPSNLGLFGVPGTLLIDPQGLEVGRLIGPADWDSSDMIAFIEAHISQADGRRVNKSQSPEQKKKEPLND
jgi:hypothetical protein